MALLILNAGSSSLKFSLYANAEGEPRRLCGGAFSDLDGQPRFTASAADRAAAEDRPGIRGHARALRYLFAWLAREYPESPVEAAGHRIVHGGPDFAEPTRLDAEVLARLRTFIPLAPLHMPHNLALVDALRARWPDMPQVACFDTAFHRGMPEVEQRYALPDAYFERGVRRYGFHGLSYEYIASVLPDYLGEHADGRVVVAHLGHGASLCALRQRRSVATSMGFTPLDGVPMATRPGALDPGVVVWLMREAGLSVSEVDELLNQRSGLLGLSGLSGDIRELLADDGPGSALAIDYFVHHTQRQIASMAAALGGLDALVFTAGIGEHSATLRQRICDAASWLGIVLDTAANQAGETRISAPRARVSAWRIPTDEEQMIATHTSRLLRTSTG